MYSQKQFPHSNLLCWSRRKSFQFSLSRNAADKFTSNLIPSHIHLCAILCVFRSNISCSMQNADKTFERSDRESWRECNRDCLYVCRSGGICGCIPVCKTQRPSTDWAFTKISPFWNESSADLALLSIFIKHLRLSECSIFTGAIEKLLGQVKLDICGEINYVR